MPTVATNVGAPWHWSSVWSMGQLNRAPRRRAPTGEPFSGYRRRTAAPRGSSPPPRSVPPLPVMGPHRRTSARGSSPPAPRRCSRKSVRVANALASTLHGGELAPRHPHRRSIGSLDENVGEKEKNNKERSDSGRQQYREAHAREKKTLVEW